MTKNKGHHFIIKGNSGGGSENFGEILQISAKNSSLRHCSLSVCCLSVTFILLSVCCLSVTLILQSVCFLSVTLILLTVCCLSVCHSPPPTLCCLSVCHSPPTLSSVCLTLSSYFLCVTL